MSLKDTLKSYSKSNIYPFHMPGHKRQLEGIYKIDMTEVEGVDDLHDPTEVIKEEQERIAKIYNSKNSFILVGGSTVGNLAAIYGSCNEGDKILIQRNSHKSVYNAVMLRHLKVEYVTPTLQENGIFDAVSYEQVRSALDAHQDAKAIVLTSPTYEGFHIEIEKVAELCKKRNVILIVDQAHGAHLGFNNELSGRAVEFADITIQSLHKTLPCLTQTALLHINSEKVSTSRIREALDIFETSSPSYVLMNSISDCMDLLKNPGDIFDRYVDNLRDFYSSCGELKNLKVLVEDAEKKDIGKLVILTSNTNITGVALAKILREKYEIETEMSSFNYVLAMTSIMDTKEGFSRLSQALIEIDKKLEQGENVFVDISLRTNKVMEAYEAKANDEKPVSLTEAIGQVSATMVCLYPPGAPLVVPGEEISEDTVQLIGKAKATGIHVTGLNQNLICVVN